MSVETKKHLFSVLLNPQIKRKLHKIVHLRCRQGISVRIFPLPTLNAVLIQISSFNDLKVIAIMVLLIFYTELQLFGIFIWRTRLLRELRFACPYSKAFVHCSVSDLVLPLILFVFQTF